jgi:NagD protein
MISQFEKAGFESCADDPADVPDVLVVAFDMTLEYSRLCRASWWASQGVPYIATNPDYVCPTEFGSVPDCGSVCDMIFNATGKRPVVIGKPSPLMPELAMKRNGYSKEEVAVVGDRIYTDVKSGLHAGITGILVMSGETTQEILDASKDKPHLILKDASEILQAIK